MTDGRGWHGDPEEHRDAALRASERRYETHWRYTKKSAQGVLDGSLWSAFTDILTATVYLSLTLLSVAFAIAWAALSVGWTGSCFLWEQASGWLKNVWEYRRKGSWTDVVPPTVERTIKWLIDIVPDAFGIRGASAYDQVAANIVLIAVSIATSLFTGGITIAFVAFWMALLLYALFFRETPEGNRIHREVLSTVSSGLPISLWGDSR